MPEIDEDEQFYSDTQNIAHPKLNDQQLAMLEQVGTRRVVRRGELVIKAGQRNLGLTAVFFGERGGFASPVGEGLVVANAQAPGFLAGVAVFFGPATLPDSPGQGGAG